MKKMCRVCLLSMAAVAVATGFGLLAGCESADGLQGLTVSPSSVTLSTESNNVVFAVVGVSNSMALPLEWSVSDGSLGTIIASSGYTATYRRTSKNGNNLVTAKDQYQNEGFATVEQTSAQYSLTLAASPATLTATTNTATITVSEGAGEAPYTWWVKSKALGAIISGGTSDTAVYQAYATGVNVVHVRDANGVLGTIAIERK
jgi:hypothetical protein